MYASRSSFFWSNSMTQSSTANNRPPMNSLQALGLIWKADLVYDARPATMRSASYSFGSKQNRLARWQPWSQFVLSENQNDLALDKNFRWSAMWSKRTSQLDDIPRIWGLKWHADSSGCHEDLSHRLCIIRRFAKSVSTNILKICFAKSVSDTDYAKTNFMHNPTLCIIRISFFMHTRQIMQNPGYPKQFSHNFLKESIYSRNSKIIMYNLDSSDYSDFA